MQDSDLSRLAQLAQLHLSDAERQSLLAQLNNFFDLVQQMQAVDTHNVEPLAHPLDAWRRDAPLLARLRADAVTETDIHEAAQVNAPQVERDLYLVPRVVE